MNILIINGSPRKGNTWKIVERLKLKLANYGDVNFEEIHLSGYDLDFCRGCFTCFEKGEDKCPHYKQFKPIIDKIKECDSLIITSPVYVLNVTALIKNLFDHMAYFYHRPYFFTKKAIAISTTAGAGVKQTINYLDDNLKHMGFNKVYKIAITNHGNTEISEKLDKKIDSIANSFYNDVTLNKTYVPSFKRVFYYNMWRKMNDSTNSLEADHNYWRDSDLANYVFSPDVKMNFLKKSFGKVLYFILDKFIK